MYLRLYIVPFSESCSLRHWGNFALQLHSPLLIFAHFSLQFCILGWHCSAVCMMLLEEAVFRRNKKKCCGLTLPTQPYASLSPRFDMTCSGSTSNCSSRPLCRLPSHFIRSCEHITEPHLWATATGVMHCIYQLQLRLTFLKLLKPQHFLCHELFLLQQKWCITEATHITNVMQEKCCWQLTHIWYLVICS